MRQERPVLYTVLSLFIIGATVLAGGVAAQTTTDNWCLNLSSDIGLSVTEDCSNVVSTHDKVNVSFQRTSPSTSNDVYFLPSISSDIRQPATLKIDLVYTVTGKTVDSESLELSEGENVSRESLSHDRNNGGNISDGAYKVRMSLISDGRVVSDKETDFSGFYTESVDESEINSDLPDASTTGTGQLIVTSGDVDVDVNQIVTDVSRYNDQTTTVSELQDTAIPPVKKNNTSTFSGGAGIFKDFSSMRERENPTLSDSTIRSVSSDGDQLINVGTATYGIPEARNHRLALTYSMQVAQPTGNKKIVGVEVVNSQGEVIDPDKDLSRLDTSSPRWLDDTVKDSVDTTRLEQLRSADDDILNQNSVSIKFTQEEIDYINSNFEAYLVYRTPESGSEAGITVFKPFRSAIYSTDAQNLEFEHRPEEPVPEETVQLNITDLPEEFEELGQVGLPDSGPASGPDIIWNIDGNRVEQNISYSQYEQLRNNDDATIEGPSEAFATGGAKTVEMTIQTPDKVQLKHTRIITVLTESQSIDFEDTPATFDVSYDVLNNIDPKYGTVDVPPTKGINTLDKRARVEVTIENSGNSQIQREVALQDDMVEEFGYTGQTRDTKTVNVPPQETVTIRLSTQWEPDEYGNHEIYVVEYKNGDPQQIPNQDTGDYKTDVYVEQPATLKIDEITAPESHLVYDNFDTTVYLENVGDLSTKHPSSRVRLNAQFADTWDSVRETPGQLPDIAGGDVRADSPGGLKPYQFDRDIDYTPAIYPDFTQVERQQNDSPWTNKTTFEEKKDFTLKFDTEHLFAQDNQARFKELNDAKSTKVRIYRMSIVSIRENGEFQTGIDKFSASGYKFTENHYTSDGERVVESTYDIDQHEWVGWNSSAIPTTNITQVQPPTTENSSGVVRYMDLRVGIDNPGTAPTGTARIQVEAIETVSRNDRKIYYPDNWDTNHPIDNREEWEWYDSGQYEDNVVGVAGIDLSQWETRDGKEEKRVKVPVVIPNHPQNKGEYTLKVSIRDAPDYIKLYEEGQRSQFDMKVDVKTWGDSIYIGYENNDPGDQHEQEVYQDCTGGSGPPDGQGDCLNSGNSTTDIGFVYRNVGGAPVEQSIDAYFHHKDPSTLVNNTDNITDHHQTNHRTRDIFTGLGVDSPFMTITSNGDYDNNTASYGSFWEQDVSETIQPQDYYTWDLEHEFVEPGLYKVRPNQYRYTQNASRYSAHHDVEINRNKDFESESNVMSGRNTINMMVWDDVAPVSRFHYQDCTDSGGTSKNDVNYNQCLEQEYNGLSSLSDSSNGVESIWEGGSLRFDGDQRERFTPSEANTNDVSSDNVGVNTYIWKLYEGQSASGNPITINRIGDTNTPAFVHRFDDSGYYTAKLTVKDYDAYVSGDGNTNQNVHSETIYVKEDNSTDDVDVYDLECGNTTNSELRTYNTILECWTPTGEESHVWSDGPHTAGADISWASNISETGVGVEFLTWSTNYSSNSTFDSKGNFNPDPGTTGRTTDHSTYDDNVQRKQTGDHYATDHYSFDKDGGTNDNENTVSVTLETTDFAGNTSSDTEQITVVTDNSAPDYSCTTGNADEGGYDCYSSQDNSMSDLSHTNGDHDGSGADDEHNRSASTTTCVTLNADGPGPDDEGIGFHSTNATGDGNVKENTSTTYKVCVSPEVSANVSGDASASVSCDCSCSCGGCGECEYDSDYKSDDDEASANPSKTHSSTVTVEDYHGNTTTVTIGAYVETSAYDYDEAECGPCDGENDCSGAGDCECDNSCEDDDNDTGGCSGISCFE